ncbi:GSCOCG00000402001-RA-CDS [Cotesia congregata]|nr:GSCOCG00000402001-RA-CDS [Cotesia congregata]
MKKIMTSLIFPAGFIRDFSCPRDWWQNTWRLVATRSPRLNSTLKVNITRAPRFSPGGMVCADTNSEVNIYIYTYKKSQLTSINKLPCIVRRGVRNNNIEVKI